MMSAMDRLYSILLLSRQATAFSWNGKVAFLNDFSKCMQTPIKPTAHITYSHYKCLHQTKLISDGQNQQEL